MDNTPKEQSEEEKQKEKEKYKQRVEREKKKREAANKQHAQMQMAAAATGEKVEEKKTNAMDKHRYVIIKTHRIIHSVVCYRLQ